MTHKAGSSATDTVYPPITAWATPIPDADKDYVPQIWNRETGRMRKDFRILRLPITSELRNAIAQFSTVPQESWSAKYGDDGWQAVSLTSSKAENRYGEEAIPVADYTTGGKLTKLRPAGERPFTTPVYEALLDLWPKFEEITIVKPRLTRLIPSHVTRTHIDGMNLASFHLPLVTNPGAGLSIEGVLYHLPADGHIYAFNTEVHHHIFNLSPEYRTHMLFHALLRKNFSLPVVPALSSEATADIDRNSEAVYRINHEMIKSTSELYWSLLRNVEGGIKRFKLIVEQDAMTSGVFGPIVSSIIGVLFGYEVPFYFAIETPTGRLDVPRHNLETIKYLKSLRSRGYEGAGAFYDGLDRFFSKLDFI